MQTSDITKARAIRCIIPQFRVSITIAQPEKKNMGGCSGSNSAVWKGMYGITLKAGLLASSAMRIKGDHL
jgi:hypothetical protein